MHGRGNKDTGDSKPSMCSNFAQIDGERAVGIVGIWGDTDT